MADGQGLGAVAQLRDAREQVALQQLAAAQTRLQTQQRQLEELLGYLGEYEHARAVPSASWLANRAQFLGRLREACANQMHQVELARQGVQAAQARHLLARQDVQVLEKLREGYRDAERRMSERRGQHEIDDLVSSRWRSPC